jgi:hypothetical protein
VSGIDEVPVEVVRCPVHHIPDCSPLLNGCSIPARLAAAYQRGLASAPRYCASCGTAPCRYDHPPLEKNR